MGRGSCKALAVLHLLAAATRRELDGRRDEAGAGGRVVVFCSTVDTAHRLARLLQILLMLAKPSGSDEPPDSEENPLSVLDEMPAALCEAGTVAEFSSSLVQAERSSLLEKFRKAQVRCLVCSDVVARGIDIPELQAVINYSAPRHLSTYIHRAGRTARAGRVGYTFTFVTTAGMPQFEEMLKQSADCWDRIDEYRLPASTQDAKQHYYTMGLKLLELCLQLEGSGRSAPGRALKRRDLEELQSSCEGQLSGMSHDRVQRRSVSARPLEPDNETSQAKPSKKRRREEATKEPISTEEAENRSQDASRGKKTQRITLTTPGTTRLDKPDRVESGSGTPRR